ncbi:UNKNOWN [Stylonychia lemnae]|uniref:Uncharacterized protein n=1 Tax=Stylonychia lemnae TaxID=5949 RepID=A0A077ZN52_STYLE|nr:UNKNOWN [Stylonychia lemnae]|eukprot:CDW71407.1 UNKNOWN [Stylonychia lemnae]
MVSQVSPNILGVRDLTGDIYILYTDLNELGVFCVIANDLSEIAILQNIEQINSIYNSMFIHQSSDLVLLMGTQITQDQQFAIFVVGFNKDQPIMSGIYIQYNASTLVNYDAIIPQMEEGQDYIVGCLESQAKNKPLLGMIIHQYFTENLMVIYRKPAETLRSFQCLGLSVAKRDDIQIVYSSVLENEVKIIIAKIKKDPFDKITPFDNAIYEYFNIQKHTVNPKYFKYISNDINDFFHLGNIFATDNQQRAYFALLNSNTYFSITGNQDYGMNQIYNYLSQQSSFSGSGFFVSQDPILRPKIQENQTILPYLRIWQEYLIICPQSLIAIWELNVKFIFQVLFLPMIAVKEAQKDNILLRSLMMMKKLQDFQDFSIKAKMHQ